MAEAIARSYAARRGRALEVRSAGTLGIVEAPADPHAVAVCREIGVDLEQHASQGVDEALIEWADYVLVMEFRHARELRERFPEIGDKLLLLGTFGGTMEIADPIGSYKFRFRRIRDEVRRCVELFVDRLPPARES